MFLVFHEIVRLAVLINFVLIKKKECILSAVLVMCVNMNRKAAIFL